MQTLLPLAIIEDQSPIREMLHKYLGAQPEFECVLTAVSIEELGLRKQNSENGA